MKKVALFLLTGALTLVSSSGTAVMPSDPGTPAAAADVVKDARHEAAASYKRVLILFHASWCHWCRKLDTLLSSPECKDLFGQSYVIRHLTVMESRDKANLENPG